MDIINKLYIINQIFLSKINMIFVFNFINPYFESSRKLEVSIRWIFFFWTSDASRYRGSAVYRYYLLTNILLFLVKFVGRLFFWYEKHFEYYLIKIDFNQKIQTIIFYLYSTFHNNCIDNLHLILKLYVKIFNSIKILTKHLFYNPD